MAFVPALIAGLGGLGGLFGNRSQTQRTTQNTQFNNQGNQQTGYAGAASSNPLLNPAAQSLLNPIANNYLNLIGQDQDLSGYKAGAIGDINQTSNIHKQALEANLAQRGNQLGGLFGGLGTTLAGLYGMGSFGGPGNNNGPNRLPTQRI